MFIGGARSWGWDSKSWLLRLVHRKTVGLTFRAWIPLSVLQVSPSPHASPTFPITPSTAPKTFVSLSLGRGEGPSPTTPSEVEEVRLLSFPGFHDLYFISVCPCLSEMYTFLHKFSLLPQSSWVNTQDFYPPYHNFVLSLPTLGHNTGTPSTSPQKTMYLFSFPIPKLPRHPLPALPNPSTTVSLPFFFIPHHRPMVLFPPPSWPYRKLPVPWVKEWSSL